MVGKATPLISSPIVDRVPPNQPLRNCNEGLCSVHCPLCSKYSYIYICVLFITYGSIGPSPRSVNQWTGPTNPTPTDRTALRPYSHACPTDPHVLLSSRVDHRADPALTVTSVSYFVIFVSHFMIFVSHFLISSGIL
jgi:hypothetical protein